MTEPKNEMIYLFGLFKHTSRAGEEYWKASLGPFEILIFKNKYKGEAIAPDLKFYIARDKLYKKATDYIEARKYQSDTE